MTTMQSTIRKSRQVQPRLTKTTALRQSKSSTVVREYEETQGQPGPSQAPGRRQYEPKKIEFTKPRVTKAALARQKHAEKLAKERYEREIRKQAEALPKRPKARGSFVGDPRFRERPTGRTVAPPKALPQKTKELARSMNAQVIVAEPIDPKGPIDSVVIPPNLVSQNRTTIVSIPKASAVETTSRSVRAIKKTLDEQDAAEAATVQGKLEDLQEARRDFVMVAANVSGSAAAPERYIQKVPELESEYLRVKYGRKHPDVVAARQFLAKMALERLQEPEVGVSYEKLIDVPSEGELMLARPDLMWEEETPLAPSPTQSEIGVLRPYKYPTFDPEELERFFDVEQYLSPLRGPPRGREQLPPELWEIEDPWGCGCPQQEQPEQEEDLMRFESP